MNSMPTTVLVDDAAQVVKLPVPCCICVSHASYRFDEVGMHRRDALDVAFASSAVDTRGAVIHVAGQQWDEVNRTFTSATIATHGFGVSTNVTTLTFPAATLLALLSVATQDDAGPGLAIGLALGGCMLVAVLAAAIFVWHRKRRMQPPPSSASTTAPQQIEVKVTMQEEKY